MGQVCPIDLKGCCDDLCYGGGCLRGGGAMVYKCNCGQYVSDDDHSDCMCEPTYEDDEP